MFLKAILLDVKKHLDESRYGVVIACRPNLELSYTRILLCLHERSEKNIYHSYEYFEGNLILIKKEEDSILK